MRNHTQLLKHDPENGVYGDCMRAALASILDCKDVRDVPHFFEDGNTNDGIGRINEFLAKRQMQLIELPIQGDFETAMLLSKNYAGGIYHMLIGESRTGCNHVVVCRDGEIVHDPSPVGAGIIGPAEDGFYWIGFLAWKT